MWKFWDYCRAENMSIFVCAKAEEADSFAVSTCIEKDMIRVDVSANRVDKLFLPEAAPEKWMEQVCTEPDYCEDSGTRKTEDYTRICDSEFEDAK